MKKSASAPSAYSFSGAYLGHQTGLGRWRTWSISAENLTGEKWKGEMKIPHSVEIKLAASVRAADKLGQTGRCDRLYV